MVGYCTACRRHVYGTDADGYEQTECPVCSTPLIETRKEGNMEQERKEEVEQTTTTDADGNVEETTTESTTTETSTEAGDTTTS